MDTKNLDIGYQIPPVSYEVTQEKINTFSRFVFEGQDLKNIHTDDEAARKAGLPAAVAQGRYPIAFISEEMLKLFGEKWFRGGKLSVDIKKPIFGGDIVTVGGVVTEKMAEGDATRLVLEVWLENQKGDKVTAGKASGLV